MGAVVLALGYAWARLPRADWWKAGAGAAACAVAAVAVQQIVVAGSIADGGRSFAQVRHYSAELSDLVTRGVGAGIEEYVFLGWLTPLLALAGLWAIRRQRGLALFLALAAVVPCLLALGVEPAALRAALARAAAAPLRARPRAPAADRLPGDRRARRVRRRLCVESTQGHRGAGRSWRRSWSAPCSRCSRVDVRVPVFGAVAPDRANAAYAAIRGDGRLLELPVFRPDIHFGSVYLGLREAVPARAAAGLLDDRAAGRRPARAHRCGRSPAAAGTIPAALGVRFVVVHRGLYGQSGFFAAGLRRAGGAALRRDGWRLLARDGAISSWQRP